MNLPLAASAQLKITMSLWAGLSYFNWAEFDLGSEGIWAYALDHSFIVPTAPFSFEI